MCVRLNTQDRCHSHLLSFPLAQCCMMPDVPCESNLAPPPLPALCTPHGAIQQETEDRAPEMQLAIRISEISFALLVARMDETVSSASPAAAHTGGDSSTHAQGWLSERTPSLACLSLREIALDLTVAKQEVHLTLQLQSVELTAATTPTSSPHLPSMLVLHGEPAADGGGFLQLIIACVTPGVQPSCR